MAGLVSEPNVLVIGDPRLGHFESIVRLVRRSVGDQAVRIAADFSQLENVTAQADGEPRLIVILQTWPDQFSMTEANALIAKFPLARIVCCCGPWCDSDGRTRSIWPLAVRVSPATFAPRFEHELRIAEKAPLKPLLPAASPKLATRIGKPDQPLPLTASRSEIFEFDFDGPPTRFSSTITAAVLSPDRAWRVMLSTALANCGAQMLPEAAADRASVVLFDADPWNARRASQLAIFRQAHPNTLLVACSGFPRPDLDAAMRESGADHVWFKLEPLDSLAQLMIAAFEKA